MFSRPLFRVTGLVGLEPNPNPLPELQRIYNLTLRSLKRFPEQSAYAKATAVITRQRLEAANESVEAVEKFGLVEQVVIEAEKERQLAEKMLEWKAWEKNERNDWE